MTQNIKESCSHSSPLTEIKEEEKTDTIEIHILNNPFKIATKEKKDTETSFMEIQFTLKRRMRSSVLEILMSYRVERFMTEMHIMMNMITAALSQPDTTVKIISKIILETLLISKMIFWNMIKVMYQDTNRYEFSINKNLQKSYIAKLLFCFCRNEPFTSMISLLNVTYNNGSKLIKFEIEIWTYWYTYDAFRHRF